MVVPIKAAAGEGPAPSQAEVSSFLNAIFTSSSSGASIDASYGLCELLLNSVGYRGLQQYGVLAEVRKASADKKSGVRRESAQNLLGALFERFPPQQPIAEVAFLLQDGGMVACALDALADKGPVVRDAAQYGLDALFGLLSPEALVVGLLPALTAYLSTRTGKWQGAVGAYKLMQKMADKAQIAIGVTKGEAQDKDILREAMGTKLASLIPLVEDAMHDQIRNDLDSTESALRLMAMRKELAALVAEWKAAGGSDPLPTIEERLKANNRPAERPKTATRS